MLQKVHSNKYLQNAHLSIRSKLVFDNFSFDQGLVFHSQSS